MDNGGRSDFSSTKNQLTGTSYGSVVQAGTINNLYLRPLPETTPPSQLPPVSRFFTGRRRELAELTHWSASSRHDPMVAVITGLGGVGKTTLALRFLHDQRARFVDGQLYADLGALSTAGRPAGPESILEWFLVALGLSPQQVPAGLSERAALFRSVTASRVIAVLLDNAFSVAQVRPLLPTSSGSVVLVTSRWRLAGLRAGGAHFLTIEPMDVAESVTLLDRIVGDDRIVQERDEAAELARLCGGMPIALSVAGARLIARPNRPVVREVGLLRQTNPVAALAVDGETPVQAVFDLSYSDLRPREARIYRTSALHPGRSFGVGVVAAAVRQSVEDVEQDLDALAARNLLTETDDGRFRFHDLLLLHARQQADREPPDDRRTAVHRMAEWYLDMMIRVDLTLRPTRRRIGSRFLTATDDMRFDTIGAAIDWAERERDNVTRVLRVIAEQRWDDIAWEFCEALWGFLVHTRRYDMWAEAHEIGLAAAGRCGDRVAEARVRTQLASGLAGLRRFEEAREHAQAALEIAREDGDRFGMADTLWEMAGIAQGQGDLQGALACLSEVRAIREVIGTERSLALCRRRTGQVLCDLGSFAEGAKELRHAAAAFAELGDVRSHERTLTFLGVALTRSGRPVEAREMLNRAADVARRLGIRYDEAVVLDALGDANEMIGDLAAAREHWSAAEAILAAAEHPLAAAVTEKLTRLDPG